MHHACMPVARAARASMIDLSFATHLCCTTGDTGSRHVPGTANSEGLPIIMPSVVRARHTSTIQGTDRHY